MNQLVQEMKIFEIESKQLSSRKDNLILKQIIDEPLFHNSGGFALFGDTTSYYELEGVNYLYLNSNKNFNLVLNDSVIINSQQFTYLNRYRRLNVAIQCTNDKTHKIDFVYGNLDLGDEAEALSLTKPTCSAKWSRGLKNIVLTLDSSVPPPAIFPNISHICGALKE